MPKGTYLPDDIYSEEQSPAVNNELEVWLEVCYSHHQPRSNSYTSNNGKLHYGWEPPSNFDREYAEESYGSNRDFSNRPKYSSKELPIRPIISNRVSPCAHILSTDQTDASLHNNRHVNPTRGKNLNSQLYTRKTTPRDNFERMPYTREPETKKLSSVTSNTSDRHNIATASATRDYELMGEYHKPHRVGDDAVADYDLKVKNMQLGYANELQDFTRKAPLPVKYDRGLTGEIPSSSSSSEEDESGDGEKSSSDDE